MIDETKKMAPAIWGAIQKASRILINTHVGADFDSICSALAMKLALESLGKEVLVFSPVPLEQQFLDMPGQLPDISSIVISKFSDLDLQKFDLFLCLDSESGARLDRFTPPQFPLSIPTVVIDHHKNNLGFGDINLIVKEGTCTSQLVYWLLKESGLAISPMCAKYLFLGIWSDTGQFMLQGMTTRQSYADATELIGVGELDVPKLIWSATSSSTKVIKITGDILSRIEECLNGKVIFVYIAQSDLERWGAKINEVSQAIDSVNLTVSFSKDAYISVFLRENTDFVKVSLRNNHQEHVYDVSAVAKKMGNGGGHARAAGTDLQMPFAEAKALVLKTIQETFPDLAAS